MSSIQIYIFVSIKWWVDLSLSELFQTFVSIKPLFPFLNGSGTANSYVLLSAACTTFTALTALHVSESVKCNSHSESQL